MNIMNVKYFIDDNASEADIFEIIQMCAEKLEWEIGLEKVKKYPTVRGIIMGTTEYMKDHLPPDIPRETY